MESMKEAARVSVEAAEFLFHYTSVGTAKKIVCTRELWATHIYYLNDGSEFDHGIELMRDELKKRAEVDGTARAFLADAEWPAFDSPSVNVFVVSFSEVGDLLSQWRSYCPPNRGISLGIEPQELQTHASTQGFELVKCSYDFAMQQAAILRMADDWLAAYDNARRDGTQTVVIEQFVRAFARLAASFKHASFAEEREWRLIAVSGEPLRSVQYREGLSTLVPYITFKLPIDGKKRIKIRRIILGPTPHAYLARAAVTEMVKNNFVLLGQISPSQTPFRAW
jgi:hypothetical protein